MFKKTIIIITLSMAILSTFAVESKSTTTTSTDIETTKPYGECQPFPECTIFPISVTQLFEPLVAPKESTESTTIKTTEPEKSSK